MSDFNRIFLTGDKHADFDEFIQKARRCGITDADLVIITGDVSINFYGNWRDRVSKEALSRVPGTILCVRGNHEMRPTDPSLHGMYRKVDWMGDMAYVEEAYPRFIMAADGARYHINGRDFLVIGGAYSVDKPYRLQMGWQWFPDEQLTETEMAVIRKEMVAHGNCEDIILAHTCPYDSRPTECFLSGIDESQVDNNMEHFLQEIVEKVTYNQLYCGHWHIDKQDAKIRFLFRDIVMLE
ncbi:MAG: metallophosphoesterase [Clostridia bacterium]|nr:metallophosphoesterase [Clostridia bacterium]MBR1686717.1 metallophosphoesterase [Clostridia bacterium]